MAHNSQKVRLASRGLGVVDSRDKLWPVQELSRALLLPAVITSWDPYLAISTGPRVWLNWVEVGSWTWNIHLAQMSQKPPSCFLEGQVKGPDQRLGSSDSKKGEEEKEDPLDWVTREGGCGALPWPAWAGGGEVVVGGAPSGAALSSSCKYLM